MKNTTKYSRIIAGAMTWGQWGKQLSKKEMADLIIHCLEVGLTTFDHADIYGGYTNETDFGQGLAQSGIAREEIQLITKCGIQYVCEARTNRIKHYDYSSEYIIWSAEQSLRKLQTDYVDLFLLHRPSPLMRPDEIAEAIGKLKKQGKIKEFGVSNFTPMQIALLETRIPVSANQIEFSLTAEGVMYDGTLDDCLIHARTAMSWSPLGNYFKEANEQTERIKKALSPMQRKYEATPDQLLLAWIMAHPVTIHPVIGTTTKHRLEAALKATEIQLDLEDWFILLEASQGHKVP